MEAAKIYTIQIFTLGLGICCRISYGSIKNVHHPDFCPRGGYMLQKFLRYQQKYTPLRFLSWGRVYVAEFFMEAAKVYTIQIFDLGQGICCRIFYGSIKNIHHSEFRLRGRYMLQNFLW